MENAAPKKLRRLYVVDYLLTPHQRIDHGAVLCENNRILAIGGISAFAMEPELEVHKFSNSYLTPGFIDTHIHGAGGFDCSSAGDSINAITEMSRILAERGVTTFVPTVVADVKEAMLENLSLLADLVDQPMNGAVAGMLNIEGPFINPLKRGAQAEKAIRPIDLGFTRELLAAGRGKVKLMTFAPELKQSEALVELLVEAGVIPSMGHSVADDLETLRAIDAGASHCTHLFNGMPPLHQREISLANIALTDNRVTVEMIIDGRHVHPRMVDLACRCKPANQIVGISDCTMAAGMPNGFYRIGPSTIRVENGFTQTSQHILAGTTTMLDSGWHSLMSCGHLSEKQAAAAVTCNPAESLGLADRGELLPNKRADLAIFECGTNRPLMTIRNGEIVYRGPETHHENN